MHEKGGNFCIFLLKIAEKEETTGLRSRCLSDEHIGVRVNIVASTALAAASLGAYGLSQEESNPMCSSSMANLLSAGAARHDLSDLAVGAKKGAADTASGATYRRAR